MTVYFLKLPWDSQSGSCIAHKELEQGLQIPQAVWQIEWHFGYKEIGKLEIKLI